MIFGDVTPYDAKIFSDMFGEKEEFKEAESEQGISPMQENPVSRLGSTYQKTKEVVMSPGDIMAQGAFICAARIVQDNHVQPVQQITSNFVPKEEFFQAITQVDMETGRYWENERLRLINESIEKTNAMKHVDAENLKKIEPLPPMQDEKMELDNPIALQGEQQHIVSLENYREHKSESVTLSNDSAVVSQQAEVDEEEAENKLYEDIKLFVIDSQQVSPAFLQRKFKISYMKAARLIDKLEQNQVVSSYAGNGPRKVLISNDNGIPILTRESDINTSHSSDTNIKKTISQEVAIPGEDNEAAQEETNSFKDILYDDVLAFVKEAGTVPISVVQDKFNISYTRASRLIDALQRNGEMPVAELNKELSITMLGQEWANDSIIHSEIPYETEPFHKTPPANELPITITGEGEAETNIESTAIPVTITAETETNVEINTIPVTETVNQTEENKLDEEVAKVYESISITVHQNLEKNMVENTEGNEEQHEYKRISYKERQEHLKAQQNNKNNNTQSLLNKNEEPKTKTSNVMSKSLDDIFGNIES
ncbi:hypothetical protein BTGOE6_58240 [Bacillus wiedmannii]|nr:hypothetical protein BTGOE6_58240 [Bacillus wiedmannii]